MAMARAEAMAELERIATEAPYERDRIQAIRLLREMWAEDEDPRERAVALFQQMGARQ
jgi:hypothetical protein